MLRAISPPDDDLLRLCRSKKWDEVCRRLQSHSVEAQPSEACLGGEGSTVLAIAVRAGAPMHVLQSLLKAHVHQIALVHRIRGSVLHEAVKHQAADDVLEYLLDVIVDYQRTVVKCNKESELHQFKLFRIQEKRILTCPNILGATDDLGRTVLHCFVERASRLNGGSDRADSHWKFFTKLIQEYPESCKTKDSDGNTPLILMIQAPLGQRSSRSEHDLHRMIEILLSACPESAIVTRDVSRPWRFPVLHSTHSTVIPASSQTPLYYAVIHGRSLDTILSLMNVSNALGASVGATYVTCYHEVLLHVAVTTRSPVSILFHLVSDSPKSVSVKDVYGLTPLEWVWVRHVLDWHSNPMDLGSTQLVSRRRFLPNSFRDWHDLASDNIPIPEDHQTFQPTNRLVIRELQEDLLQRMRLFLPIAAVLREKEESVEKSNHGHYEQWSLLHAACYVPCPLAIVRAALYLDGDSVTTIQTRDVRSGRYPLHYAATRLGYQASLPIGVSRTLHTINEKSPVFEIVSKFPQACGFKDQNGQLPLHIAIDTAKTDRSIGLKSDRGETELLQALLSHGSSALEQIDGKTNLYPWQQAAAGPMASLTTIYMLLRIHPAMIHWALTKRNRR